MKDPESIYREELARSRQEHAEPPRRHSADDPRKVAEADRATAFDGPMMEGIAQIVADTLAMKRQAESEAQILTLAEHMYRGRGGSWSDEQLWDRCKAAAAELARPQPLPDEPPRAIPVRVVDVDPAAVEEQMEQAAEEAERALEPETYEEEMERIIAEANPPSGEALRGEGGR